jgi:hypothetical protein
MLALYRSGRQPEALAVYRDLRSSLADELAIEPSQALRELEGAILRQDPELDAARVEPAPATRRRTLLVASFDESAFDALLSLASSLARQQDGELMVVRLLSDAAELGPAANLAAGRRASLGESGVLARTTAFTSAEPAADILRLAGGPDVALAFVGAIGRIDAAGRLDDELAALLGQAPCDAAVLLGAPSPSSPDDAAPVLVPFGGSEHEWAAAEIGAWIAKAEGRPLRLVGTSATPGGSKRDASRLLASVALLVQRVVDVDAEPALALPGSDALAELADEARVVLVGLPDGWSKRGIGRTRAELVRRAGAPMLLIRGGSRPGVLAQAEGLTRFTWTITDASR